jgi:predicted metal-dependent hydrolase
VKRAALAGQLSLFDEPPPAPVYRHPLAEREALLDGVRVGYRFRRARRRSIGFVVDGDGLTVSAPRWVTRAAIDEALQEKARWVIAKLAEQHDRARRLDAARIVWRDGAQLPFLGRPLRLRLNRQAVGAVLQDDDVLLLGLPAQAAPAQIRDAAQGWLQRQARRLFDERCRVYADQLGVRVTRLGLSSATTRWGSASADGAIRLHWKLVHFALPVIDYVVAHELAHLREMNHGPRFWALVQSVLPDYEAARAALRDEALAVVD